MIVLIPLKCFDLFRERLHISSHYTSLTLYMSYNTILQLFCILTSSIRKSLTICTKTELSFHFLVIESHFSGVVSNKWKFTNFFKSYSFVSPVISRHFKPRLENLTFQSKYLSEHNAFIGATATNTIFSVSKWFLKLIQYYKNVERWVSIKLKWYNKTKILLIPRIDIEILANIHF